MSAVATAVVGGAVVGGYMSSKASKKASKTAADAQTQSAQLAAEEQQRQFDAIQELLKPYTQAGTGALAAQQNLLGLNGADEQQRAIDAIGASPQMAALMKQGEDAILQNASATGNLRGGNTQAALAQFRPQLLSQLIQQQYQNLGGITSVGQNAAAMTGNAGMQTGNAIAANLNQAGAAAAGSALAAGKADAQMWSGFGNSVGMLGGMYASGAWKGF